jgi:tetratricopeptide (TPR) repeat protein
LDVELFLENLDDLNAEEFQRFSTEADSAPKSAERSACLALCAAGTGDMPAALAWIEDAIRFDSSADFVSFASATIYLQTGNLACAIDQLQRVGKGFAKYHDAQALLATAYVYSGRTIEAESVALAVEHQDDDMRAALLGLRARCAQARSDEIAAQAFYQEALTYAPQLEWVRQAIQRPINVEPDSSAAGLEVVVI